MKGVLRKNIKQLLGHESLLNSLRTRNFPYGGFKPTFVVPNSFIYTHVT